MQQLLSPPASQVMVTCLHAPPSCESLPSWEGLPLKDWPSDEGSKVVHPHPRHSPEFGASEHPVAAHLRRELGCWLVEQACTEHAHWEFGMTVLICAPVSPEGRPPSCSGTSTLLPPLIKALVLGLGSGRTPGERVRRATIAPSLPAFQRCQCWEEALKWRRRSVSPPVSAPPCLRPSPGRDESSLASQTFSGFKHPLGFMGHCFWGCRRWLWDCDPGLRGSQQPADPFDHLGCLPYPLCPVVYQLPLPAL